MTAAATTGLQPGKLDIGRVISETFAVIGRNFVTFAVLALLLSGVPLAIIGYIQASTLGAGTAAGAGFNFSAGYFESLALGVVASVIATTILQGALIYGTVQDMNGERPTIGACLSTGLRAFLPLLGLAILLGVSILLGFFLFVVPGIMLACAWCVAVPALVADRTGVMGAFTRSAELTRGNRWRIFGLFVIVWVLAIVISALVGILVTMLSFGPGSPDPLRAALSPVRIVGNAIVNALTSLITSTGAAVLYVELRRAREGQGPQWLAEVFS